MDDISRDLARSVAARKAVSPELLRVEQMMEKHLSAQDQQASSAITAPQASPSQPAVPPPGQTPKKDWNIGSETWRVTAGAVRDAAQEFRDTISEMSAWADENVFAVRDEQGRVVGHTPGIMGVRPILRLAAMSSDAAPRIPEVAKPDTTAGQVTRSIGQFVLPFIGEMKALGGFKALTKAGAIVKGAAAGAAVDFAAFDPHEKRLSNMIMEMSKGDPVFGKAVFEYLSAKDTDTAMEGRLKNVMEGMGLGMAVEGLFLGVKALKKYKAAKGEDPSDLVKPPEGETPTQPSQAEFPGMDKKSVEEGAAAAQVGPPSPQSLAEQVEAARKARLDPANQSSGVPKDGKGQVGMFDEVGASTKEATVKPKDPDAATKRLDEIVSALQERGMRRAFVDPDNGRLILSNERPQGTSLNLDDRVKAALEASPHERTAEDLIALRAMRQLQEAAAKALDIPLPTAGRVFSDAERAAARSPLILAEARGQGLDDVTRAAARAEGEQAAASAAAREAAASADAAKQARVDAPRAERTGPAADRAAREAAREEAQAILENAAALGRVAREGRPSGLILQQGGFTNPTLLAHIAAAGGAGTYGFTSADPDASLEDRLGRAGVFAAGALGITVGGRKLAKTVKENFTARSEKADADEAVVQSLARPEMAGIAPKAAASAPAKLPKPDAKLVNSMLDALQTGQFRETAKLLDESPFNLNHLDTDEQIDDLINSFAVHFESDAAIPKHQAVRFAKIEELAKDLGTSDLTGAALFKDTKDLSARVLAMRTLLVSSAEHVKGAAENALKASLEGADDSILAARRAIAFHAGLQARMKGVQSEVGRALAQFRITAGSADFVADEMRLLIDGLGGKDANIEALKKIAAAGDPRLVHSMSRKSAGARTASALYEGWVNGILSGLGTHSVNLVGNGLTVIFGTAEKTLAATLGAFRSGTDKHTISEVLTQFQGMKDGLVDTLRLDSGSAGDLFSSARAFFTEGPQAAAQIIEQSPNLGSTYKAFATGRAQLDVASDNARVLMGESQNSISGSALGFDEESILGKAFDYLGAAIRTPASRLLVTSDEMFKVSMYRGEMRASAYRQALREGLDGQALAARAAELLENPTPEMIDAAFATARKGTFSQPLGETGQAIQALINKVPVLKMLAPFVRTPINIMTYAFERMPVTSLMSKQVRADLKAGGATRDMALAKLAIGHSLFMLAWDLKQQGVITGGGDKQKGAERLAGEQAYSVKVGDKSYSFNRLDPFGFIIGVAADLADISTNVGQAEMDELAAMAMLAVQRNVVSKSYVKGLVDASLAVGNPEMYGEKWVQQFVGSWIPSWSANLARANDPHIKEVWSVLDAVKARLPGLSKDVPNHVNLLGEDVVMAGLSTDDANPMLTNLSALGSPVKSVALSESPLAKEVLRLNIDLRHPTRSMRLVEGAPAVDLTPQQYYRLMKLSGSIFKSEGEKLVNSARYKKLPEAPTGFETAKYDGGRERAIRTIFEKSMDMGRQKLISEDKDLQAKYELLARNVGNVMRGKSPLPMNQN